MKEIKSVPLYRKKYVPQKWHMELSRDGSEKVNYDSDEMQVYACKGDMSLFPGGSEISHWHTDFEFVYILSGKMKYNVAGNIISLEEGEGIFVNSGRIHFGFSDKNCEFICILLHPVLLCLNSAFEKRFLTPFMSEKNAPYAILKRDVSWQSTILDSLIEIYSQKGSPFYFVTVEKCFYSVFEQLIKNVGISSETGDGGISELKDMLAFIRAHYADEITLYDIAASGSCCVSKCCKLFRKYLGQTPIGYLAEYRVSKSIELLITTDMTVTEIAYEAGFHGASYYAETFKKCIGCSPKRFRADAKGHKA